MIFQKARNEAAKYYDLRLSEIEGVVIPKHQENSTHCFSSIYFEGTC
jgi:hypothetical protein